MSAADAETSVRAFDAAYYERCYRSYDLQNPPRKLLFYRRTIERLLPPGIPRRIHDVGCAFGAFLGSLGPEWEPFGSDVSEHAVEQARTRHPRVRFAVADPCEGPTFDGSFGVVTAFDVLEHVPDLDACARSIQAQSAPGGLFVFVVPVYDGVTGPAIRMLDRDPTHIHKWSRSRWLEWTSRRFEVVEWSGILRYLLPWGHYLHLPTRLLRQHTPAILVAARVAR